MWILGAGDVLEVVGPGVAKISRVISLLVEWGSRIPAGALLLWIAVLCGLEVPWRLIARLRFDMRFGANGSPHRVYWLIKKVS
jgi:hypothetical protein